MSCIDQSITTIMQQTLVTVSTEDTVHKVEQALEQFDVSSVPVIDPERHDCFGVISLKDIQHFHSVGRNALALKAWEICTYKPLVATVDTTIGQAAQLMREHKVHHLAVNNLHRKLVGYVSTLDVIEALLGELLKRRRSDIHADSPTSLSIEPAGNDGNI